MRNLGIKPGDRVIVLLPNCPEVIFAYQATMLIGAVVVPVLFLLQPEEVKHILNDSGAVAAFTSVPFMEKITEAAEGNETFKHLILVGEKEPNITGAHWYSDIIA
ncbi:MAG TPA: acyl-CoA synthetase, partial [Proteobacteria bacterium]|nr:acyl-CoA synthetase [Pseudomonadota bacterium]